MFLYAYILHTSKTLIFIFTGSFLNASRTLFIVRVYHKTQRNAYGNFSENEPCEKKNLTFNQMV